ncbi:OLC1v1025127C1 [Oldenlandia corymbosa var. corymbosa]|uniref:OLC1v1025127C1 n=1 Tax=Oldenlandia corymbosa var. corymbosa TaxID=529605 RepID=A0AAV1C404_OLDCO|nr:OLC1v1025127C1 [Oldenlandia corymbosa var. corymbosa]
MECENFDLENPLPISDDSLSVNESRPYSLLFSIEDDYIPCNKYSQECHPHLRQETFSSILQISHKSDRFSSYLAINYLDRFLSSQPFLEGRPWILRLVAVACVSLALKMRKTESVSIMDLQINAGGGFMFDCKTIEKMELLVLGALKWRMRSITPFSFINYFITLFQFKDLPSMQALKSRATEIMFKAQNETKLLEFKPSILSASALLSASHELFPLQFPSFKESILSCSYVNKDTFLRCYIMTQDLAMEDYESALETAYTPANVLDLQYSSSSSSSTSQNAENGLTLLHQASSATASAITTLRLEKDLKRRKIDGADDAVHIFQGHTDEVLSVACSPTDPNLVATGGIDDTGFLWNICQGDWVFELKGHSDSVSTLGFSFDGQLLASGSFDGLVKVWDISSQNVLNENDCLQWVKWHPRGHLVLAGSEDSSVFLWNAVSELLLNMFSAHNTTVTCGDFTPDGHTYHTEGLTCLSLSSDSTLALTGSSDSSVHLVNLRTGKV